MQQLPPVDRGFLIGQQDLSHGGAIARPWKNGTSRESRHCLLLDVMHLNDVSSPFIPTDDLTMNDNGEQSERHET